MDHRGTDDDRRDDGGGIIFRPTEHERNLEELQSAQARLRNDLIPKIARIGTGLLGSPLLYPWRDEIARKVEQVLNLLVDLHTRLGVLLLTGPLPITLWRTADEWTQIRSRTSSVAGDLGATNREVHVRWKGAAADAYHSIIPAHVAAANRLAMVADSVQNALAWAALAAATFYAALLGAVLAATAAIITAIAMAATVTGALAALVMVLATVAGLMAQLGVLTAATTEVFGRLRVWLNDVVSEMNDNAAFPGGTWPASREEWYADATVTDGDARWSVQA